MARDDAQQQLRIFPGNHSDWPITAVGVSVTYGLFDITTTITITTITITTTTAGHSVW
jgi:hypothetical protein